MVFQECANGRLLGPVRAEDLEVGYSNHDIFPIPRQYFPPIPCKHCLQLNPGQVPGFFFAPFAPSEKILQKISVL